MHAAYEFHGKGRRTGADGLCAGRRAAATRSPQGAASVAKGGGRGPLAAAKPFSHRAIREL